MVPPLAIGAMTLALIYFIFKLIKSLLRSLLIIFSIIGILFLIGAMLIANDASQMRESFPNATKTFYAIKDGEAIAGFRVGQRFEPLEELDGWRAAGEQAGIQKRIFVINDSALALDPQKLIPIDGSNSLSRGQLHAILIAPSAGAALADALGVSAEAVAATYGENDLKARIFGYLAQDMLNNQTTFARLFKSGQIELYPQGPALWAMQHMPLALVEQSVGNTYLTKEVS